MPTTFSFCKPKRPPDRINKRPQISVRDDDATAGLRFYVAGPIDNRGRAYIKAISTQATDNAIAMRSRKFLVLSYSRLCSSRFFFKGNISAYSSQKMIAPNNGIETSSILLSFHRSFPDDVPAKLTSGNHLQNAEFSL